MPRASQSRTIPVESVPYDVTQTRDANKAGLKEPASAAIVGPGKKVSL